MGLSQARSLWRFAGWAEPSKEVSQASSPGGWAIALEARRGCGAFEGSLPGAIALAARRGGRVLEGSLPGAIAKGVRLTTTLSNGTFTP